MKLNELRIGTRYNGWIIDHDKHSSTITYIYLCEEENGANPAIIATKDGFIRTYASEGKRLDEEIEYYDISDNVSVVVIEESRRA